MSTLGPAELWATRMMPAANISTQVIPKCSASIVCIPYEAFPKILTISGKGLFTWKVTSSYEISYLLLADCFHELCFQCLSVSSHHPLLLNYQPCKRAVCRSPLDLWFFCKLPYKRRPASVGSFRAGIEQTTLLFGGPRWIWAFLVVVQHCRVGTYVGV